MKVLKKHLMVLESPGNVLSVKVWNPCEPTNCNRKEMLICLVVICGSFQIFFSIEYFLQKLLPLLYVATLAATFD